MAKFHKNISILDGWYVWNLEMLAYFRSHKRAQPQLLGKPSKLNVHV
jgi:hypothetical protein